MDNQRVYPAGKFVRVSWLRRASCSIAVLPDIILLRYGKSPPVHPRTNLGARVFAFRVVTFVLFEEFTYTLVVEDHIDLKTSWNYTGYVFR